MSNNDILCKQCSHGINDHGIMYMQIDGMRSHMRAKCKIKNCICYGRSKALFNIEDSDVSNAERVGTEYEVTKRGTTRVSDVGDAVSGRKFRHASDPATARVIRDSG